MVDVGVLRSMDLAISLIWSLFIKRATKLIKAFHFDLLQCSSRFELPVIISRMCCLWIEEKSCRNKSTNSLIINRIDNFWIIFFEILSSEVAYICKSISNRLLFSSNTNRLIFSFHKKPQQRKSGEEKQLLMNIGVYRPSAAGCLCNKNYFTPTEMNFFNNLFFKILLTVKI